MSAATRRLAHLLLARIAEGLEADAAAAERMLDRRVVAARDREAVVREATALARAAGSWLEERPGELRSDVRAALRDRAGRPFLVTVPSAIRGPDRAAVMVMAPTGDRGTVARARRWRFAVRAVWKTPTEAFVARPDGTVTPLASLTGDGERR